MENNTYGTFVTCSVIAFFLMFVNYCQVFAALIFIGGVISLFSSVKEEKVAVSSRAKRLDDKMNAYIDFCKNRFNRTYITYDDILAMVSSLRCCGGKNWMPYPQHTNICMTEFTDLEAAQWLYNHYQQHTVRALESYHVRYNTFKKCLEWINR